jgi:hypothetical protein
VHTPIAIPDTRLTDLLDPLLEIGLAAALGLVDIKRSIDPEGRTGAPDRNLPVAPKLVDKFTLAGRP